MRNTISRRSFLQATAATAALASISRPAAARAIRRLRPDKLRIAVVGTQNQAASNISQILSEQIVALCDVDAQFLDDAASKIQGVKKFRDYREMLTAQLDLDAVLISCPDHHHGPAAALALRQGKPVYCEKPLAHTVEECRTLASLAAEKKLATQMGTQIHAGSNYRRVVELIQSGAIGDVTQAYVWCDKSWSSGKYSESKPAPAHLDWELWLGPAPKHDYCDGIHPGNWRRFWEYGTGTLGDMACHYMDLVHWALDLKHPTSIESIGPAVDAVGTPKALTVHYQHPARGSKPPVKVTWHDGGIRPEISKQLKNKEGAPVQWGDGHLFVGTTGMILSDYGNHLLFRDNKQVDFTPPKPSIPESIGHHAEWFKAIREGTPTTCNFDYSGALAEAVLLGNVAFRVGKKLEWNAKSMEATNAPEASKYIKHAFRDGWKL